MKRVALSWSSGKDSTWALHVIRKSADLEVVALITTFNCTFDRVAMHAVRRRLVTEQAERARLPLWPIDLPWPCSNADYEAIMTGLWRQALAHNVDAVAFGDLLLENIRAYREKQLKGADLEPLLPIWRFPTAKLARDMIRGGVKAKLTCVDPRKLDPSYAGRDFDAAMLDQLPASIDLMWRTASSIPLPSMRRYFRHRSTSKREKWSNATGLYSRICSKKQDSVQHGRTRKAGNSFHCRICIGKVKLWQPPSLCRNFLT